MKKQLLKSALMAVVGVVSLTASAQAITFNIFTDKLLWLGIVDPLPNDPNIPLVENFDDLTLLPGFTITEYNGLLPGVIQDGMYQNVVNDTYNGYQSYNYAPGMTAFGGEFNLAAPGGVGGGIEMYVNSLYVLTIPNTNAGQFYGFTASETFYSVEFKDADRPDGAQETYWAVDISIAPVPEPATMLLFGAGIAGLAGIARRRKEVVA